MTYILSLLLAVYPVRVDPYEFPTSPSIDDLCNAVYTELITAVESGLLSEYDVSDIIVRCVEIDRY